MDRLELDTLLGTAYGLDVLKGDRPGAVAYLRNAIPAGADRDFATSHLIHLAAVKRARSLGNVCGCFVTGVTHDLLRDALNAA